MIHAGKKELARHSTHSLKRFIAMDACGANAVEYIRSEYYPSVHVNIYARTQAERIHIDSRSIFHSVITCFVHFDPFLVLKCGIPAVNVR